MATLLLAGGLTFTACSDDDEPTIYNQPIVSSASVITGDAVQTAVSATITGKITDLSSLSTSAYKAGIKLVTDTMTTKIQNGEEIDATLGDDGTFTVEKTGLKKNQKYYYAAFVTLQGKVSYYGEVKTFTTTDATVSATKATDITMNQATLSGTLANVTTLPSDATLSAGMLLSRGKDDTSFSAGKDITVSDVATAQKGTPFTLKVKGLLPNTKYYYKAYMKLNDGYIYSSIDSLTTADFTTEFVDLGLSVQWAKTNIGASSEEEEGGLYSYGDPTGLQESATGSYANVDITGSNLDICAASASGGRLPSVSEVQELLQKCQIEDATENGVAGYKVTGPNGNSIFIPKAGVRNGSVVDGEGSRAELWTGSIDGNDATRAYTFDVSSKTFGAATTSLGLSARAVRQTVVPFTNSKLVLGNNNDDARIEIYNAYGSTKDNPGLDATSFMFTKKMYVTFTIVGLPDGTAPFNATIGFADGSWSVQDWSSSVTVKGNGTYTIPVTATQTAKGVNVFVIDLKGKAGLFDDGSVKAFINSIVVDDDSYLSAGYTTDGQTIDQSKLVYGNLESNKDDYRIEIYNAYGETNTKGACANFSNLDVGNALHVVFSLEGMGTLTTPCRASIMFASGDLSCQNWDFNCKGSTEVTKDGVYTASIYPTTGAGGTPAVFTVDIKDLKKQIADLSTVKAKVLGIFWE